MQKIKAPIHYQYVHEETESTTGYFGCIPDPTPEMGELVKMLALCPLDSFLRRYALPRLAELDLSAIEALFTAALPEVADAAGRSALAALLAELGMLSGQDEYFSQTAAKLGLAACTVCSPLVFLRHHSLPEATLQASWSRLFFDNIHGHKALPLPEAVGLKPLYAISGCAEQPQVSIKEFIAPDGVAKTVFSKAKEPLPAEEVATLALERLSAEGALAGEEMRHVASLSPIALLRPWKLELEVENGRNRYTLSGKATAYGRGLSLPQALASCRMEVLERYSAYVSIKDGQVLDRAVPMPLLQGSYSELLAAGYSPVQPSDYYIEVPYQDDKLFWVQGTRLVTSKKPEGDHLAAGKRKDSGSALENTAVEVLVPLQMVSLFSNLDEVDLCSSPGSTGIATGTTMEQARLAALLEILERDAEATTFYEKSRCFVLRAEQAEDELIRRLLESYAAHGINVQFMDMSGPMGIPCYQCFVIGPRGVIHRGHGAGLSARKAIVSALTETPYPYPGGGASGPLLRKLPELRLEELPDYSQGSPAADLALLEKVLLGNGLEPVYVELTHARLQFPVVRALLPGRSQSADFDDFTGISERMYGRYLAAARRRAGLESPASILVKA